MRAYYYSGIWTEESIRAFIRLKNQLNPNNFYNEGEHEEDEISDKELFEKLMQKRKKELDFLRFLNRSGYHVVTKPVRVYKDYITEEPMFKANLDIEIVLDMQKIAPFSDEIVLVTGDGDFAPVVRELHRFGVRIILVTTLSREAQNNGYKASEELVDAADEFIDIVDLVDKVRR